MSVDTIKIELELEDGSFVVRSVRAGKVIEELGQRFDRTDKSIKNIEKSITGFLPRLRDLAITASILKGGLTNLYNATLGWQKTILDTNAQIERMTFLLKGMSTAATETGRIQEAASDMEFLFDQAERAPFSLNQMTDSFVKMRSVGLEKSREAVTALTDAVAQFGGSNDVLHRASVAIQQMAGKGVISMEELRQQLGEAVPTAVNLMARSMSMTYQELVKQISLGRVEATDALQRMFREMERTMGGASLRMMDTWSGMVSVLQTRWIKFQLAIGENQAYEAAKGALSDLIDALDPATIAYYGKLWGEMMAKVINSLVNATKWVVQHREAIADAAKTAAAFFFAWKGVNVIAAGINLIAKASSAMMVAFGVTKGEATALGKAIDGVKNASGAATKSLALLRLATTALLGPIGLMISIIAAATAAFKNFGDEGEKAWEKVQAGEDIISDAEISALESKKNIVLGKIAAIERGIKNVESNGLGFFKGFANTSQESYLDEQRRELARLKEERMKADEAIAHARMTLDEQAVDHELNLFQKALNRKTADAQGLYRQQMEAAAKAYEASQQSSNPMSQGEYQTQQAAIIKDFYNQKIAIYEAEESRLTNSLTGAVGRQKAVIEGQIKYSKDQIAELRQYSADQTALILQSAKILETKDSKGRNSKLDNVLASARAKIAELNAEIGSGVGAAERFKAQLANGVFGNDGRALLADKQALEQFVNTLAEAERLEKQLAEAKRVRREADNATKKITDEAAASAQKAASALSAFKGADTSFVDKIEQEIAALIAKVPQASKELLKLKETWRQNAINAEGIGRADDWVQQSRQINRSLMRDNERFYAEYLEKVKDANEQALIIEQMTGEERKAAEKALVDYKVALLDEYQRASETPMQSMLREWQDVTGRMQDATANWLDSASDKLVDFVKTGKLEFGDLVESILSDILKLQIQGQISGLFGGGAGGGGILSSLGSLFGGGGGSLPAGGGAIHTTAGAAGGGGGFWSSAASWIGSFFADGGIMSKNGSLPLRMYSNGGVANSPQMAIYGEGSMNEAYVPLPDGRSIPVTLNQTQGSAPSNVVVNVINQTSQEVNANQGQTRFDGKQMILDVVLQAAGTPGPFRDSMKGALR